MQHHFDVDLAVKYGVTEAIILNHFEYWIELNKSNEKNYYEGRYWTFNSMKAFSEIFPYLSLKKIRNALKHLQDEGLILTGNFNRSSYDRTLWYAFSDLAESILTKGQMDDSEKSNGLPRKGKPIPDNNTPGETNNNLYERFESFWAIYPKKKSKQAALTAWKKLKPDEVFKQKIIAAVQKQKQWPEWQKDNGQYIPYPATWLNQRRWEDEGITTAQPDPPKKREYREIRDENGEVVEVVWLK